MELAATAWPDVSSETDLALLPVGSTEQHGPHAPLGTDSLSATAVAEAGADAHDEPVMVAPTVPVGIATEHRHFRGTLWVTPDTFRSYVREIIESLAHHGWNRVVVVNGHGGNTDALREICGELSRAGSVYSVPFTWFDAVDADAAGLGEGMGHGGAVETSLVAHLRPEQVHTNRFEAAAAEAADSWGEWVSGVNLAFDSNEFASNGVVGDPRESDPAAGERLLDQAANALSDLLAAVGDR